MRRARLGVTPGSSSTLLRDAVLMSMGAGFSSTWPRWSRPQALTARSVASARSRAAARSILGQPPLARPRRSAEEVAEPVAQPASRLSERPSTAADRTSDLVAERCPHRAVQRARLARLRPDQERLAPDVGTAGGREPTRHRIDVAPDDALGHRELAWHVGSGDGAHELGPDRQGSLRARESGRAAAVEPDPHARDDLGGVADEPRVARVVG